MSDLKWTQSRPEEPGYYYFCHAGSYEPLLIKLFRLSYMKCLCTNWDGGAGVDNEGFRGGQWWGPFRLPQPPALTSLNTNTPADPGRGE